MFFFFFSAIIGLQFFFLGMCLTHFYSIFFSERGGGAVKFGLYVFRHNNNFNLINIYSAKTFYNRIQKNYGSIYGVNKTIIWIQIHFLFFKSNSSNLIMCLKPDMPFIDVNWSRCD